MAKYVSDTAMDQELNYIAACDMLFVTNGSANPTNWTDLVAWSSASAGMASGSFVIADGDVSGRKVTVAAKSSLPIEVSASATHVVLGASSGSTVRLATTCTTQYLTAGGTVDVPSFKLEITDPT